LTLSHYQKFFLPCPTGFVMVLIYDWVLFGLAVGFAVVEEDLIGI